MDSGAPSGNQIRTRNSFIERGKDGALGTRELCQVSIRDLLRRFYPGGKMGNIVVIQQEGEGKDMGVLQTRVS